MAKATERIFLPMLRTVIPEIRDYFLPWEGVFHNISVVALDKEFPSHAKKLAAGVWGQGQMSFCKAVVAVDGGDDPSDLSKVWRKFLDSFDPERDVFLSEGVLDALDHSAPRPLQGSKIAIDLTDETDGETKRNVRKPSAPTESDIAEIESFLKSEVPQFSRMSARNGFCAIAIDKENSRGRDILEKIGNCGKFAEFFRAAALFDSDVDIENNSKILWKIFNNTDPSRDIMIVGNSLCLVDACRKNAADGYPREWPDDLSFDK